MKRGFLFLTTMAVVFVVNGQNYNSNSNVNNNNVIINSQPVIERVKYIEKYRTVYRDKPQPKRVARKLASPVCLLGSIWVFTEDLGDFRSLSDAYSIVQRLNTTGAQGRNDWRIPTSAELAVMEQNADKIGLGEGIYLATSHSNGILRPVSTGLSIAQQRQQEEIERRKLEEERRKQEAERRKQEAAANARRRAQQNIITSGQGIMDGDRIWATKNVGAYTSSDNGSVLTQYSPRDGWRLPSSQELKEFAGKATMSKAPSNGYLKTFYSYNGIVITGGRYITSDGYYDVGTNNGLSGNSGYVRLVRDVE